MNKKLIIIITVVVILLISIRILSTSSFALALEFRSFAEEFSLRYVEPYTSPISEAKIYSIQTGEHREFSTVALPRNTVIVASNPFYKATSFYSKCSEKEVIGFYHKDIIDNIGLNEERNTVFTICQNEIKFEFEIYEREKNSTRFLVKVVDV